MADKLFYSMGEVAEMFDVNTSLIRHWESQFSILRQRNKKGNLMLPAGEDDQRNLDDHRAECRGAWRFSKMEGHLEAAWTVIPN